MTWTIEKITAHCTECGDCLLWNGGLMNKRYPIAKDPVDASGKQPQLYVRRRVWELLHDGKPAPANGKRVLTVSCGETRCVAPGHLVVMSRSKRMKAGNGRFRSVETRARVAAAKRSVSRLSDDAAAEIRASSETGIALAARHGISVGYAYAIKAGRNRIDYIGNPFAALLAAAV